MATTVEHSTPAVGVDSGNDLISKDAWNGTGAHTVVVDYGEDADISTADFDDVADGGALDEIARADHVHGMPAEPEGGGDATPFLDTTTLDSTYGDEFDGASLDGRWTREVITSGEETYEAGGGTNLLLDLEGVGAAGYYQTPGTMPTNCELILHVGGLYSTEFGMFGPWFLDGSGNGLGATFFNDNLWIWNIAGFSQSGSGLDNGGWGHSIIAIRGFPYWLKFRKAGTDYHVACSWNGKTWSPESTAYAPGGFTPTRFGFGRFYRSTTMTVLVDRFNVENAS